MKINRNTRNVFEQNKEFSTTKIDQQFDKTDLEYQKILDSLKQDFEDKWKQTFVSPPMIPNNFQNIRTLGTGTFGRVILTKQKATNKFFAIKILAKSNIVKLKQIEHTFYEKKIMMTVNFPFLIYMVYSFKDNSYLYFVLPFINGGEMFTHLRRKRKFDENLSKFYAAQVVLSLEYLHHLELIYRDLKPENIIIADDGYLKIIDFGFCKLIKNRTWTLCGTPEYLAPEVILSKGYGFTADWWSFGVLVYEMSAGYSPFYSQDQMIIFEKIVSGKYKHASHFSLELKDFLTNMLQVDLSRRYGNLRGGISDIKNHKWFKDIDWINIYYKNVRSPFVPICKSKGDSSNFDIYDEKMLHIASFDRYSKEFQNF